MSDSQKDLPLLGVSQVKCVGVVEGRCRQDRLDHAAKSPMILHLILVQVRPIGNLYQLRLINFVDNVVQN